MEEQLLTLETCVPGKRVRPRKEIVDGTFHTDAAINWEYWEDKKYGTIKGVWNSVADGRPLGAKLIWDGHKNASQIKFDKLVLDESSLIDQLESALNKLEKKLNK
jgi:hypothetical protein